jgi:hypothetical protein
MIGAYIRKLPYLSTGLQPLSPSRPMPETIPNLTGQSTLGPGSTDPVCLFGLARGHFGLFVLVWLPFTLICACSASHLCLYQIYG